jgi:hypothetical protein
VDLSQTPSFGKSILNVLETTNLEDCQKVIGSYVTSFWQVISGDSFGLFKMPKFNAIEKRVKNFCK